MAIRIFLELADIDRDCGCVQITLLKIDLTPEISREKQWITKVIESKLLFPGKF